MREDDIMNIPKVQWKKFVISYITDLELEYLIEENSSKSKTMHIKTPKAIISIYFNT